MERPGKPPLPFDGRRRDFLEGSEGLKTLETVADVGRDA
jgi:hypothetical protein